MLQQTQVDRVVPHYERFVEAFPTPAACADAGVGRGGAPLVGTRLQPPCPQPAPGGRATIVERHGGRVPGDDAALRALPGVGPYTARAVRVVRLRPRRGGRRHERRAGARRGVCRSAPDRPGRVRAGGSPGSPRRLVGVQPVDVRPRCHGVHGRPPRLHALSAATSVRLAAPRRRRPVAGQPGGATPERLRRIRSPGRGRLLEALRRGDVRCVGDCRRLRLARRRRAGRPRGGGAGGRGLRRAGSADGGRVLRLR